MGYKTIDHYKRIIRWLESDIIMRKLIGLDNNIESEWYPGIKRGLINYCNFNFDIFSGYFRIIMHAKITEYSDLIFILDKNKISYDIRKSIFVDKRIETIKIPYAKLEVIIELLRFA